MGRKTRHSQSSWRFRAITVLIVVGVVALTPGAGFTNAYGTGYLFQASALDLPDGAAADTFWDAPILDLPGLSLYSVHCHGRVHFDIQYGSTGPTHSNPCYASLGIQGDLDRYMLLPVGNQALYRCSTNQGPWIYYIGGLIYAPADESHPPPGMAAMSQGHCNDLGVPSW